MTMTQALTSLACSIIRQSVAERGAAAKTTPRFPCPITHIIIRPTFLPQETQAGLYWHRFHKGV